MKRFTFGLALELALALVLAGCTASNPPNQAPVSQTPQAPPVTTADKPGIADATPANSANSGRGSASTSDTKSSDTDDPSFNLSRINQLKSLKVVTLHAAGTSIQAWIMDNESKRQEGMMFLTEKDVKENQGMIFVYPDVPRASSESYWMKNCPLGLDIIWIDPKNKVINVSYGVPQNEQPVASLRDYDWVLEMKHGWAQRHGLKPGDKVEIPTSLKATG